MWHSQKDQSNMNTSLTCIIVLREKVINILFRLFHNNRAITRMKHVSTHGTATFLRVLPLCAHGFEHRGQQPSIYGRDLGDVERLAPITTRFLHALPQARAAGTVTQRAREVAAPARGHCYPVHSVAARLDWRVWRVGGEGWGGLWGCQAQTVPAFHLCFCRETDTHRSFIFALKKYICGGKIVSRFPPTLLLE